MSGQSPPTTSAHPQSISLQQNPLVNSVIIFIAAWVDGRRRLMTERIEQRKIRIEA
jgi:hypothetical protein